MQLYRTQVAALAAGALQQASGNVIIEAWADSTAPYTPVNDLLGSVRPLTWQAFIGARSCSDFYVRSCCIDVSRYISCVERH